MPLPEGGSDVLIIAREGHQGFIQRIDAFKKHHGITEDTARLHFMRGSVSFMQHEDFKALLGAIAAQPVEYALTIVDTVARVLAGVDMNAQETVTTFMERCSAISAISGAATIGVHHQNKTGSMMGSIYFEANSDFVFEVTRDGEEDEPGPLRSGEILCTKMKDGEDGWKRSIRYESVGLTPESGSLVVGEIGGAPVKKSGLNLPEKETCRRILNAINEAWLSGSPMSHMPQAKRSQKYAQRILAQQFKVKAEVIERLLLSWIDNDVIAFEQANAKTKAMGLRVLGSLD